MKVFISASDVKNGKRGNSLECPAACALERILGEPVRVGEDYALTQNSLKYMRLSTPLLREVERYDLTGFFKPGTYEVFTFA